MKKILKYLFNPPLFFKKLKFFIIRKLSVKKVTTKDGVFYKYKKILYPEYLKNGNAAHHISELAKSYCKGKGLDIGASKWPLEGAIPVENHESLNAFKLDKFKDNSLDFIFSSHCLEHLNNWQEAVDLWIKKINYNGILFLYLPHESMKLWSPGGPWVEDEHKWVPSYKVINKYLKSKNLEIIDYNKSRDEYYSFHIIAKK